MVISARLSCFVGFFFSKERGYKQSPAAHFLKNLSRKQAHKRWKQVFFGLVSVAWSEHFHRVPLGKTVD